MLDSSFCVVQRVVLLPRGEEGCESRRVRGDGQNKHDLMLNMGKEGARDGGSGGECDCNKTRASAMMSWRSESSKIKEGHGGKCSVGMCNRANTTGAPKWHNGS